MLSRLKKKIREASSLRKVGEETRISRVVFVPVSAGFFELEEWYKTWFPYRDKEVEKLHPWIKRPEGVRDFFRSAFSIELYNSLVSKGYNLLDYSDQVIFFGDLTEKDTLKNLERFFNEIKSVEDELGLTQPPAKVGAFIIRKPDKGKLKEAVNLKEVLRFLKSGFDRIFLLDVTNETNTVISKEIDLKFEIAHLLYFLATQPIRINKSKNIINYYEWLKQSRAREDYFSGFSGVSLLNPIDTLAEMVFVLKGAEFLEKILLGAYRPKLLDGYFISIVNSFSINSLGILKEFLKKHRKYPLIYPFLDYPHFKYYEEEAWVDYNKELVEYLPKLEKKNVEILDRIKDNILVEFDYELTSTVDYIISRERGGMQLAEDFLKKLSQHVEELLSKETIKREKEEELNYSGIRSLISTLEETLKKSPRIEAIVARFLVLVVFAFMGLKADPLIPQFPSFFRILFGMLGVMFATWGFLTAQKTRNKILSLVNNIRMGLELIWNRRQDRAVEKRAREILEFMLDRSTTLLKKVELAKGRLSEVIDFFKNKYTAELPLGSGFWLYVLKEREEFLGFQEEVDYPYEDTLKEFYKKAPLRSWSNFSSPGSGPPNLWESNLLETVSLLVFPYGKRIFEIGVCDLLKKFPDKALTYEEVFYRASKPFVSLDPEEKSAAHFYGFVELPQNCHESTKFLERILKQFERVEAIEIETIYRISLFTLQEVIPIRALKVKEA